MSKAVLKAINDMMDALEIPYQFWRWEGNAVYPYFVGEYRETEPISENGMQETTFLLTGFSRGEGAWGKVESAKEKIRRHLGLTGIQKITSSGSGIAVYYSDALVVPTEDPELTEIQINLTAKEWRTE